MSVKLLTEHYLELLRLKGGCTGSSGSRLVKMPHCWNSHVTAQMVSARENKTSVSRRPALAKAGLEHTCGCVTREIEDIYFCEVNTKYI